MEEIWKDIKGFEGLYQVSNYGLVRSLRDNHGRARELILKPKMNRGGYLYVALWKDGKSMTCRIHRLVAEAFLPNPLGLPQVNHIDEDKTNNRVENLEWCDVKYSVNYGTGVERRSRRVYQYTISGEFVRSYYSTRDAERLTGLHHESIAAVARREPQHNSTGGYRWSYDPPKSTIPRVLF